VDAGSGDFKGGNPLPGKDTFSKSQPLVAYDPKLENYFANRVVKLAEWQTTRPRETSSLHRCNRCMQSLQRCNGLQRFATICNDLQRFATICNGLQRSAKFAKGVCAKRATMQRNAIGGTIRQDQEKLTAACSLRYPHWGGV
jgi:hypothetical protein